MKGFGDFRRLAVVVVPDADEYAKRLESGKSEAESGGDNSKDLSETEVNEMKGKYAVYIHLLFFIQWYIAGPVDCVDHMVDTRTV